MQATITTQSITFFKSEAAAVALATKGAMTEEDGFFIVPAKNRPGQFVIEVRDTDDNILLGHI